MAFFFVSGLVGTAFPPNIMESSDGSAQKKAWVRNSEEPNYYVLRKLGKSRAKVMWLGRYEMARCGRSLASK